MAYNYYAVREGKKTGIFESWEEAEGYVVGYPNAIHKGFNSKEAAEAFMYKTELDPEIPNSLSLQAYVDGSFSEEKDLYSCGVVILNQDKELIEEITATGNDEQFIDMRNVAGELLGAMTAIEYAIENEYKQIEVFYDYIGVEMLTVDGWDTVGAGAQMYKAFISSNENELNIVFNKIPREENKAADRLAKKALDEAN